ncbi:hypothetical protein ANANG_G00208050 [Anguilla anguilla]|uniref:G-protein coupled receptors family 1 profile domain-containing protein n=1 Tax=Anguilla anguilla TaxID=7936 RepID=A0A9D3LZ91_ANGAN|nr:hypothetical protein ANANG_G00208050 [Anguilla anguilla]
MISMKAGCYDGQPGQDQGCLFFVLKMFLFHNVTITVPDNFTQCSTRGSFTEHWQETVYNMFTFSCLFLLPLAIMISCYTRILMEISKRMTKGKASSKEVHLRRSKNNIPKARMRALKMSIVIVVSFIVCWTPYYLLGLWYWFFPEDLEETVSHSLTHMLFIFGLFNACLDPITYGLFTIHLRKRVKRYCHSATVLVESENNTDVTGSFRCPASPLRQRREGAGPGELQGGGAGGDGQEAQLLRQLPDRPQERKGGARPVQPR